MLPASEFTFGEEFDLSVAPARIKNEPVERFACKPAEQQANNQRTMADQLESPCDRNSNEKKMLFLNYLNRAQLISSLYKLSATLQCNQPIPDKVKEEMRKKIEQLNLLLMRLPIEPVPVSADDFELFEDTASKKLILELPETEQLELMNLLVKCQNAIIDDKVSKQAKVSFAAAIELIVGKLIKLSPKDHAEPNESGEPNGGEQPNENGESRSKRQRSR